MDPNRKLLLVVISDRGERVGYFSFEPYIV